MFCRTLALQRTLQHLGSSFVRAKIEQRRTPCGGRKLQVFCKPLNPLPRRAVWQNNIYPCAVNCWSRTRGTPSSSKSSVKTSSVRAREPSPSLSVAPRLNNEASSRLNLSGHPLQLLQILSWASVSASQKRRLLMSCSINWKRSV